MMEPDYQPLLDAARRFFAAAKSDNDQICGFVPLFVDPIGGLKPIEPGYFELTRGPVLKAATKYANRQQCVGVYFAERRGQMLTLHPAARWCGDNWRLDSDYSRTVLAESAIFADSPAEIVIEAGPRVRLSGLAL